MNRNVLGLAVVVAVLAAGAAKPPSDAVVLFDGTQKSFDANWTDMKGGNSGVFMMGLYEVQIFESHETDPADMKHPFYADGQAASIYGQNPPLVNPTRRRGEWQTYDIVFYRPVFDGAKCVRPGSVTVFLNGVLVQDGWPLEGPTGHIRRTRQTKPPSDKGPVKLQQHLCSVRFRNVWIRELPEARRRTR